MLPYYPFFWGDYFNKTADLSQTQHGAYMLFLRHIYGTGKPIEDRKKYHIAMAFTDEEKEAADYVLKNFFKQCLEHSLTVWRNDKCEKVMKEADEKHLINSKRAKEEANTRWNREKQGINNAPSIASSNTQEMLKQCQPKPQNPNPYTQTPTPTRSGGFKNLDLVGGVGKMLKVIDITGQLSGADIIEIERVAKGWDIENLAKVYVEGINSGMREAPRSIPKAFPRWCEKYTKGKKP
jgi:uncharacterized protein YdaU (DUF1376 family)